jgi:hypothetical protein
VDYARCKVMGLGSWLGAVFLDGGGSWVGAAIVLWCDSDTVDGPPMLKVCGMLMTEEGEAVGCIRAGRGGHERKWERRGC